MFDHFFPPSQYPGVGSVNGDLVWVAWATSLFNSYYSNTCSPSSPAWCYQLSPLKAHLLNGKIGVQPASQTHAPHWSLNSIWFCLPLLFFRQNPANLCFPCSSQWALWRENEEASFRRDVEHGKWLRFYFIIISSFLQIRLSLIWPESAVWKLHSDLIKSPESYVRVFIQSYKWRNWGAACKLREFWQSSNYSCTVTPLH